MGLVAFIADVLGSMRLRELEHKESRRSAGLERLCGARLRAHMDWLMAESEKAKGRAPRIY